MADPQLPSPEPWLTEETRPFWSAAAQGHLVLPRCADCATLVWHPRPFCPRCRSWDIEWTELSGRGTVYSFTVNRTGRAEHAAYQQAPTYVLAYVQLAEGPRILTNIVDIDPADVRIDLPVRAVFHPTDGEHALVRFAPGGATG
ncbi:Zn-ribbon domain-containing OB-fold protein [Aeromicrobium wangtongii]|uniref:Zn-ribbon domain-containing OB-fold protein n=1 Tax=Aeromicrobium wangtongii TaxID=2969247 RepID=UPI002017E4F4|nr:Zn-ribbon domain-containing OB-fold protein [Aeromicrobium wangtongii]MCL3819415.1 Zn-ribbon domain-containing OB-fold protein [Aeromicrobium wangtongii]